MEEQATARCGMWGCSLPADHTGLCLVDFAEIEQHPGEDRPLIVAEMVEHGRTLQGGAA